jgi:hypothetical protein
VKLAELKQAIRELKPKQRLQLAEWIRNAIRDEEVQQLTAPRREIVEEQTVDHKSYRLELIRCGKKSCRCAGGELHGPYWYGATCKAA